MSGQTEKRIQNLLKDPDKRAKIQISQKELAQIFLDFDRAGKDPVTLDEELTVLFLDDGLRGIFVQAVAQIIDILLGNE